MDGCMKSVTWGDVREIVCNADELASIERRNELMRERLVGKTFGRSDESDVSPKDSERHLDINQSVALHDDEDQCCRQSI